MLDRIRRMLGLDPETEVPGPPEELSEREQLEATAWRLVRAAYLRVLFHPHGFEGASTAQQSAALDPFLHAMEADVAAMMVMIDQARASGMGTIRAAIHSTIGNGSLRDVVDHTMIDEAIAAAEANAEGWNR